MITPNGNGIIQLANEGADNRGCHATRVRTVNLSSLNALRGILALFVLAHHARWLLWMGYQNWGHLPHPFWQKLIAYSTVPLRYGHESVMVFFVLSGFFIHLRAAEQMAAGGGVSISVSQFFKRRAHRLLPPYLFALLVTIILDACGRRIWPALYAGATGDAFLDENFSHTGYSVRAVAPALVILPGSLGQQFGSNAPLWSLAFEVIYYLCYPGWIRLRQQGRLAAYGAGGLAIAAIALPFANFGFLPMVFAHYPIWLAGAALAEAVQKRINVASLLRRWILPVTMLAMLGLASLPLPLPLMVMVYALGGSATVLWFALFPTAISRHSLHRILDKIGDGSYTIYIVHFPALTLLSAVVWRYERCRPSSGWPSVAGAVIVSGFCWLCYEVCERHVLHPKLSTPTDPAIELASKQSRTTISPV